MTRVGQIVKVQGKDYTVTEIRPLSHLGSKFWGKFVFVLRSERGELVEARGKAVSHNSRLSAVRK